MVRSAPTSRAPGRPFTASSCTANKHGERRNTCPPAGGHGSRHQRGTVDFVAYSEPQPQPVIDSDSTKVGRWLRARRIRIAIWVAVAEGLIVALENDISKWTVM